MIHTLVPLGVNGFFPSHGRHTMSFLVLGDDPGSALLLDAGSGTCRLAEEGPRRLTEELQRLDVVLSHYHLDHVCGLPSLPAALGRERAHLMLHAPSSPLVDTDPDTALDRLVAPPIFPHALSEFPRLDVVPYTDTGGLVEIAVLDGAAVEVRRQLHGGGSVGLRFGDRLAYVTDTRADPATVDFARGVELLVHEVWVSRSEAEADPRLVSGHSHAGEVRELAEQAGVDALMPVHHHPLKTAGELDALHRELRSSSVELVIPVEGEPVALSGRGARGGGHG